MKLSDLKAKGADKLSEEEIAVLRNNQDKLSDEDKEFFADVLKEPEGLEEEGLTFESPEALDKWLEDREQKKQEALKAEEELKKAQEEGLLFFEKGNEPADWNDAFRRATPKIIEQLEKRRQKYAEDQQKQIDELNKQFDQEIEDLRESGEEIPEAGTDKRKEFDRELAKISNEYGNGLLSMTASYKIYKTLKTQAPAKPGEQPPPPPKPGVSEIQKGVAQKIGKSGGSASKPETKYSDIKGKSMDELMEEELETLE